MDVRFTVRDDGQVDAALIGDWDLFNEALGDSISSLPPRGAAGAGPSTYWIDVARQGALRAREANDDRPFTGGNITLLRMTGGRVEARYDFADEDEAGQFMDFDDFVSLLAEWRMRVEARAGTSDSPLPETYRRNPAASA